MDSEAPRIDATDDTSGVEAISEGVLANPVHNEDELPDLTLSDDDDDDANMLYFHTIRASQSVRAGTLRKKSW